MRFAIVRQIPGRPYGRIRRLTDSAALAAVEAGRWLRDAGFSPRLVWYEWGLSEVEAEGRICAPYVNGIPRGGVDEAIGWSWEKVVKDVHRLAKLRQKQPRIPEGLGPDVLLLVGERTFAAIYAELAPNGQPFGVQNDAAAFIVAGTAVEATFAGRAPGNASPISIPTPRVLRDSALRMPHGRPPADRPWEEYLPENCDALDYGDTPLLDAFGQRLPDKPVPKLKLVNMTDQVGHLSMWYTVLSVSKTEFTVEFPGAKKPTYALADWPAWLRRRLSEGATTVHFDDCPNGWCSACDGASGKAWPEAIENQLATYGKRESE